MRYSTWEVLPRSPGRLESMLAAGIPALPAVVLCARGYDTPEAAADFLRCDESLLHDPLLLTDMDKAVARIRLALERGEHIAVYGDYDVDGITATCLLTDFLRSLGGTVTPYIPGRMDEGYGLNPSAIYVLRQEGVSLIVSVDCGITAVEEVVYARECGVDVVITDHHECKDVLPPAVAVVDPHRRDCPYPFASLAGVGVALKLALAMTEPEQRREVLLRYADLAAVGTVADVMSMTDENRAIVSLGIELLRSTDRPGFRALVRESGLEGRELTAGSIGYVLSPRINAAGRMGCADLAAELLLTRNSARADELARELCCLNRERQAIEGEIFEECARLAALAPPRERRALVLASESWHQGVVGIVASRLAERFSCPAFMICLQGGHGKGSCRSFAGFNLFAALESCSDLLEGFGGHALAAGFTILEDNIPAFRERMNALVCNYLASLPSPGAVLRADAELDDPDLLTLEGVGSLSLLEPCGAGNPSCTLILTGCTVTAVSEVGGGKHLKLRLTCRGRTLDAIFFSCTAAQADVVVGGRIDVAFTPQINEYRGWRSVQLQLRDVRNALTRAQVEQALYDKYRSGLPLTPQEAAALLPSRDEFALLWRYLRSRSSVSPLDETPGRLYRSFSRSVSAHPAFHRTMVCLEVFDERGLIELDHTADRLRIVLCQTQGKVDLDASEVLLRLRALLGD